MRKRHLGRAVSEAPAVAPATGGPLVGASAPMLAVWKVIGRAAAAGRARAGRRGDAGHGQGELVARAIHDHSPGAASKQPFVAVKPGRADRQRLLEE